MSFYTKNHDIFLKVNLLKKNNLPEKEKFFLWTKTTISLFCRKKTQVSICIVDAKDMKKINLKYKFCNRPTNVLSFPFFLLSYNTSSVYLGDILLCKEVIEKEAFEYKKELYAYWARIVIHGILHLLGFHHDKKFQELKMQKIEKKIMCKLGYLYEN